MNDTYWPVPEHIAEAARVVLGEIGLDPCSVEPSVVGASITIPAGSGGWDEPWAGHRTVLVNLPRGRTSRLFGQRTGEWLSHIDEMAGVGTEIVALLPLPVTGPTWWRNFVYPHAKAMCFLSDDPRVPEPTVVSYWGEQVSGFKAAFAALGYTIDLRNPDAQWRIKVGDYMARRLGADNVQGATATDRLARALRAVRIDLEEAEVARDLLLAEAAQYTDLPLRKLAELSGVPLATISRNYREKRAQ